ncbi:MAG: MFS transporter [Acidobacteria bacterium]|nr:MAG: MFS transporter [Acidobacteriota bacterium]
MKNCGSKCIHFGKFLIPGRAKVSATASSSPAPLSLPDVLKISGFKRLWLAQLVSILGDFLAVFGVINLITFKWHGTPLQVTNVMIAFMIPMAIVGPLAGVFVDRWNVKRTMIVSDLIRAVLILGLVWVTRLEQIFVLFFLVSTVSSFFGPAQSVTLRTLVPMNGLMSANALMSQAFYTMRILAPAAAGLLVYWLGYNSCFYLDTASFVFSAAMLSTIAIVRVVNAKGATEKTVGSLIKDYTAGSRFILTHPAISFVMIAMMTAMFVLSCFSPLISVYVRDQLHAGTRSFGIISAMIGVGLIVGTQMVNAAAKGFSKKHVALSGLVGLSFATLVLALFQTAWLAGLSMFGIGFAIAFIIVPAQTLMQQETPHDMLGRVSSSFMAVFSLSQLLGLLLSGGLANSIGVRHLFMSSAVLLIVLSAMGYLWLREDKPREQKAVAASG